MTTVYGIFNNRHVEDLCSAFTFSIIGFIVGMVIGTIMCHYGLIRFRKGTHR